MISLQIVIARNFSVQQQQQQEELQQQRQRRHQIQTQTQIHRHIQKPELQACARAHRRLCVAQQYRHQLCRKNYVDGSFVPGRSRNFALECGEIQSYRHVCYKCSQLFESTCNKFHIATNQSAH